MTFMWLMSFMSWSIQANFYDCKNNVNLIIHACGRSRISGALGQQFLIKFQQFQFLKKTYENKRSLVSRGKPPLGTRTVHTRRAYTSEDISPFHGGNCYSYFGLLMTSVFKSGGNPSLECSPHGS